MSRFISLTQQASACATRVEWLVSDEGHPLERMRPDVLTESVGAVARELVQRSVHSFVVAAGVEGLLLVAPIHGGERLVVTAALEPVRQPGRYAVSTVVRNGVTVVAAGVFTFVEPQVEVRPTLSETSSRLRSGSRDGKARVETRFFGRVASKDWLLDGNLLAWVHSSAVLSAQGFVGGPTDALGWTGVSRLGPVVPRERLVLQCSVVHATNDVVSVLSHVRSEATNRDVLWAVSRFRSKSGEVPPLLRSWPDWLDVAENDCADRIRLATAQG